MATLVIGITGKKRSGKDTLAARLIEAHGFTRVAFADPLKDAALALDPIIWSYDDYATADPYDVGYGDVRLSDVVRVDGWEAAKDVPEVRRTLQRLGVAMREHVDPEVWISAAWRRVDAVEGPVVLTDVRFPNELEAVRRAGGPSLLVLRPGLVSTDTHASETALDGYPVDRVIYNDADIAALHAQADQLIRDLA